MITILSSDTTAALSAMGYGILWVVGGVKLGLSMRYWGVALGQSIALGTCAGFGTLFPAILAGTDLLHGKGLILLSGVCITLAGIAIIGYAGSLRSKNMTEEEQKEAIKDFALTKGLLVALLAGVMSACFALGLSSGAPPQDAWPAPPSPSCRPRRPVSVLSVVVVCPFADVFYMIMHFFFRLPERKRCQKERAPAV